MKTNRIFHTLLAAAASLALAATTHAAVTAGGTIGDTALLRAAANANEGLTAGAGVSADGPDLIHDFDTTAIDATYNFASGTDIALSAGLHLILYDAEFRSTGTAGGGPRSELVSQLNLAGTDLGIGHSQGYIRRASGADECVTTGGAIIKVANDDDVLQLQSFRSDSGTNATRRENNAASFGGTAIQLIKLDDNFDFLSIEKTSDGGALTANNAYQAVSYDTTTNPITGTSMSWSSGGDITLNNTGLYLVFANTWAEKDLQADGARCAITQRLKLGATVLTGTKTTSYGRGSANGEGANTMIASVGTIVENTVGGTVLNVEVARQAGSNNLTIKGGRTAITIVKLPDSAEWLSLENNTNTPGVEMRLALIPAQSTVPFPTTVTADPPFSTTTDGVVNITEADQYLFLGNFFTDDNAGTTTGNDTGDRVFPQIGWDLNSSGTLLPQGQGSEYNRDSGAKQAGSFAGLIYEFATTTDTIEMVHRNTGQVAGTKTLESDELALRALRLGSVFPSTDPVITTNAVVALTVGDPTYTLTGADLFTTDIDTPDTGLTYTITSWGPSGGAGGTLFLNGLPLSPGGLFDTFTQDQLVTGLVTFNPLGPETDPFDFNFTVADDDGGPTASSTFQIRVIQPIALVADSGTQDEDTIATEADLSPGPNLLTNDTGNAITVTSFDALSVNGAVVSVNSDGTFTYDPTNTVVFQQLGNGTGVGAASLVDTFTYTVTDTIGKTDTATATITVSGVEDAIGAVNDINVTTTTEDSTLVSSDDLTANDGTLGTGLLLNYDARSSAGTGTWENIGPVSPACVWNFTDITLNGSPGGTRAQITAAYEWDSTLDRAIMSGPGGDSINDIVAGDPDAADATLEFWVRPSDRWDTTTATIFETGGGGGFGMAIDQGVLIAATELDGGTLVESAVSYDLIADPLDVINPGTQNGVADVEADFHQFVATIGVSGGGVALYVNGVKVDESFSGTNADWDGGDAAGLGRFAASNHGGFINTAATANGGKWNAPYIGQMAMMRLYSGRLSPGEVYNNFNAVDTGLDTEGDVLQVNGIYDTTLTTSFGLVTLPSGATVDLTVDVPAGNTGAFTYDPNGAFDSLRDGQFSTDSFTYQLTDAGSAGGVTADADVTVTIKGTNQAVDDGTFADTTDTTNLQATESVMTFFKANRIVGNDDHSIGTSDPLDPLSLPFVLLEAGSFDTTTTTWVNGGKGGAPYNIALQAGTHGTAEGGDVESNFGALGAAFDGIDGTFSTLTAISTDDATLEIWFKPDFGGTGKQLLLETGGSGTGMSLSYDNSTGVVRFQIDGGADFGAETYLDVQATGITPNEFNQLVAIYDRDAFGLVDTLTIYVNNDPTTFNTTKTESYTGGDLSPTGVNNFSGGDPSSIGDLNGGVALNETGFSPFQGQVGLVRIYDYKLTESQIQENWTSTVQSIDGVAPDLVTATATVTGTSTLGAVVTILTDGSIEYDASGGGFTDLAKDAVANDSFVYEISDGEGGTSKATVTVSVTGVSGYLAVDDPSFTIGESDTTMSFDVTTNDLGFAGTTSVQIESLVSGLLTDFTAGTSDGDPADFRDGSNHGWQFLWNAPSGWVDNTTTGWDATTGPLGEEANYQQLVWDTTLNGFMVDSDNVQNAPFDEPGAFLRISPDGSGFPGLGSTQDGGLTPANDKDRCLIFAYTVSTADGAGLYAINNSTITTDTAGNGVTIETYVNDTPENTVVVPQSSTDANFDQKLATSLSVGDTIYVAICPNGSRVSDFYTGLDFNIVKIPAADYELVDLLGSITVNGTTIEYFPGSEFDKLKAGESVFETFTYTLVDSIEGTSTATVTIEVIGVNDIPIAVDDPNGGTTDEDSVLVGAVNVLTNDTDPDLGEVLSLTVGEVMGSAGNVGVATPTNNGGSVTLLADGTFTYDPSSAFDYLSVGDAAATDSFLYKAKDVNLAVSVDPAIVSVLITPANDGVFANQNIYCVDPDLVLTGNVIGDIDTTYGADVTVDAGDILAISGKDETGLGGDGVLTLEAAAVVGATGSGSATTTATTIPFGTTFATPPVVIAGPPSNNEGEPAVLRVSNVTISGFDIEVYEMPETLNNGTIDDTAATSDLDGAAHAAEAFGWIAMEKGQYQLANGALVEVDSLDTQTTVGSYDTVNFATPFAAPPVVLNFIQTQNDTAALPIRFGTRSRTVTASSFQVGLENLPTTFASGGIGTLARTQAETIGWIAISDNQAGAWSGNLFEADQTANAVIETFFTINFDWDYGSSPNFIAAQPTADGADPSQVRRTNLDGDSVQVKAAEDTFGDTEIGHTNEVISYLAIGGSGTLEAYPQGTVQGDFTYDPAGAFAGLIDTTTRTFEYTLTDSLGEVDTTTVTLVIKGGSLHRNWRNAFFSGTSGPDNTGDGADLNDDDTGTQINLLEFGFGNDPTNSLDDSTNLTVDRTGAGSWTLGNPILELRYSPLRLRMLYPRVMEDDGTTPYADLGYNPQYAFDDGAGGSTFEEDPNRVAGTRVQADGGGDLPTLTAPGAATTKYALYEEVVPLFHPTSGLKLKQTIGRVEVVKGPGAGLSPNVGP